MYLDKTEEVEGVEEVGGGGELLEDALDGVVAQERRATEGRVGHHAKNRIRESKKRNFKLNETINGIDIKVYIGDRKEGIEDRGDVLGVASVKKGSKRPTFLIKLI